MKRAIRRHHLERMKKRALRSDKARDIDGCILKDTQVQKLANHLQCCSCHMCGNPRRHFMGKTRQELKNKLEDQNEI